MVANNKLIAYYSDQRDTNYGQKIVHQTSTDGVNWGTVVNDVTSPSTATVRGCLSSHKWAMAATS